MLAQRGEALGVLGQAGEIGQAGGDGGAVGLDILVQGGDFGAHGGELAAGQFLRRGGFAQLAAECCQLLSRGLGGAAGLTLDAGARLALGLRCALGFGQIALHGGQPGFGLGQPARQDLVFRPEVAQLVGLGLALGFGSGLDGAEFGQAGGGGSGGLLGGAAGGAFRGAGAVGVGQAAELAGGIIGGGFGPGECFGELGLQPGQAALGAEIYRFEIAHAAGEVARLKLGCVALGIEAQRLGSAGLQRRAECIARGHCLAQAFGALGELGAQCLVLAAFIGQEF